MQRTGKAGAFTGVDQVKVIDHTLAQIPAVHRADVLVTIDGAGASHEVIDHLTALNTANDHGGRGRRLEYSIGWPVDTRTKSALARMRQQDWTSGLRADGRVETEAEVVDLTGILRTGVGGDELGNWPADLRVIARRTPRAAGEQAELGEDADFRYGAFATNTPAGQVQWLDARHRTQAHVEDKMKELKATGAEKLPSASWDRNHAWIQLAALAVTLTAWMRHLALTGDLAKAEPKALRFQAPGRSGAPGPPRPQADPEDPTRLGLGRAPGHRLQPDPRPAPRLTPNPCLTRRGTPAGEVEPAPTRAPSAPPAHPPTPHSPVEITNRTRSAATPPP